MILKELRDERLANYNRYYSKMSEIGYATDVDKITRGNDDSDIAILGSGPKSLNIKEGKYLRFRTFPASHYNHKDDIIIVNSPTFEAFRFEERPTIFNGSNFIITEGADIGFLAGIPGLEMFNCSFTCIQNSEVRNAFNTKIDLGLCPDSYATSGVKALLIIAHYGLIDRLKVIDGMPFCWKQNELYEGSKCEHKYTVLDVGNGYKTKPDYLLSYIFLKSFIKHNKLDIQYRSPLDEIPMENLMKYTGTKKLVPKSIAQLQRH